MSEVICPFLGIEEDADTAVAFPSPRNRCFRSGNPAVVSDVHQDGYCIHGNYAQCPIFLLKQQLTTSPKKATGKPEPRGGSQETNTPKSNQATRTPAPRASAPANLKKDPAPAPRSNPSKPRPTIPAAAKQAAPPPPGHAAQTMKSKPVPNQPWQWNRGAAPTKSRRIKDRVITGLMGGGIMAILLAAILILPAYGARLFSSRNETVANGLTATLEQQAGVISQPTEYQPLPTETFTATALSSRTPTLTPPKPTATRTATRKPSRTPTRKSNPAIAPTLTSAPNTCGIPYGWVPYVVQPGDTLTSLSQRTGTSVYQIQSANCMGTSTMLYSGMTIYLPYTPVPINPTQAPTRSSATSQPSPAPATSTPVPTNTALPVEPTAITQVPPTVLPSPVVPTVVPATSNPVETTPAGTPSGGAN